MTRNGVGRLLLVLTLAFTAIACSKVEPGYVGIRVNNFGTERGVSGEVIKPGRYVWNGPGYQLFEFPTFKQNVTWTKEENTGLSFQTVEGLSVGADIGVTYSVDPTKVTTVFQEYRVPIDEITNVFVRAHVRDALVKRAAGLKVESVYGGGKVALIEAVSDDVTKALYPKGIIVDKVYLISDLRLPKNVQDAVNAKIQATQMAQQREYEVAQATAEAEKAVEAARGVADSTLIQAQAEAEAIKIKGDALRNNPELVELTIAERWNGKLPDQYLGGDADGKILQIMRK